MDDDFTFGASVWGSSEPVDLLANNLNSSQIQSSENTSSQPTDFEDFDGFGSPAETGQVPVDDDDFGDFGDFGDADESKPDFMEGAGRTTYPEIPIAGPSRISWEPLHLDPFPDRQGLANQINAILEPIWSNSSLSQSTTKEGLREVEGVNQILVAKESRDLHAMLVQSAPPMKPSNWIRSRIRRQHLIALGIPVNLDEVLPHAGGKPLPPLQITTRPMSAPPGPRNTRNSTSTPASQSNSRAGSPHSNARSSQFGPKPRLDDHKIKELLEIDPENLKLQSLSVIERHLASVRSQTAQTNALLTYLLQSRDSLQQDSETYNGLIAELIGEAQKNKAGKSRTATRRGTGTT